MTWIAVVQTLISGLALGATYSLVALGFVIIFSSSRIMNFAQGGFVLVGAYLTYQFGQGFGMGFVPGFLVSIILTAGIAVVVQRLILRRFGHDEGGIALLVTVGVLYIIEALVASIWGVQPRVLGDPWGIDTVKFNGVTVAVSTLWTIGICVVLIAGTFLFLRFTKGGLAMRSTANDPEAAIAVGLNPKLVTYGVWATAGAFGAIAGTLLATGSGGVQLGLTGVVFATMPAIVLGGLDSPIGAIVGGFAIGLVQQFTALLQPVLAPGLGVQFPSVTPFIILLVVLLFRPKGLFDSKAIERF